MHSTNCQYVLANVHLHCHTYTLHLKLLTVADTHGSSRSTVSDNRATIFLQRIGGRCHTMIVSMLLVEVV
jgi:hypothetical protein